MANKRCKTCKHWEGKRCGVFDINGGSPLAQIGVDSEYSFNAVYLNTDPEFGCVCWENK